MKEGPMISKVLRVVSLSAFVLVIFGVHGRVDLIALGLALWVGSTLIN